MFSQNNNHQATVTQFPATQPMVLLPGDVKFVPTGHKKDFRSRRSDVKIMTLRISREIKSCFVLSYFRDEILKRCFIQSFLFFFNFGTIFIHTLRVKKWTLSRVVVTYTFKQK